MLPSEFLLNVKQFKEFGTESEIKTFLDTTLPVVVNEFWTSKHRAANPLHEISYRACFKAQLPAFFINRLTDELDIVYDPFNGRGTTSLEAALLNRIPYGCDISPLSRILTEPRLYPPALSDITGRLEQLELTKPLDKLEESLLVFYHPNTLLQIMNLKNYFIERTKQGRLDYIDKWIQLVATNRLTGHSKGFFSVYTLPPNITVSIKSQEKINKKRNQLPVEKDIKELIIAKSKSLLRKFTHKQLTTLKSMRSKSLFLTQSSSSTPEIPDTSVNLVVTSPPFLDITDYHQDNWLRCWFNDIDSHSIDYWKICDVNEWRIAMWSVFREVYRVLVHGGYMAFEVGEVRKGNVLLEEIAVPVAQSCKLIPVVILINKQVFTKTSNCWGVDNHNKGTNSNRICVFYKE